MRRLTWSSLRGARSGPSPGPVSRRQFFGASAGLAGAAVGSALWTPAAAGSRKGEEDDDERPAGPCPAASPIPHVTVLGPPGVPIPCPITPHFFFPGNVEGLPAATDPTGAHPGGRDPSTIFDFDGVIGQADLELSGTGTDLTTHASGPYTFSADMRFMAGKFVGTDRHVHEGAFVFI